MNNELYNRFIDEIENLPEEGVEDATYKKLIEEASELYTDALIYIEKMGWNEDRQKYVDTVLEIRSILAAIRFTATQ